MECVYKGETCYHDAQSTPTFHPDDCVECKYISKPETDPSNLSNEAPGCANGPLMETAKDLLMVAVQFAENDGNYSHLTRLVRAAYNYADAKMNTIDLSILE